MTSFTDDTFVHSVKSNVFFSSLIFNSSMGKIIITIVVVAVAAVELGRPKVVVTLMCWPEIETVEVCCR